MSTRVPPSRLDSTKDFSSLVPAAFGHANAAFIQANAAYAAANSGGGGASDTYARDTANAAFIQANSAFNKANSALSNTNGATFGGDLNVTGKLSVIASSGDEGGEIFLAQAQSNTTLSGGITIDSYQNKVRFFEQGGSARGAYIDLTECVGGAGTNLLNPGATPDSTARATANAAFIKANSAYESQNTTGSYANSAYTQANTATTNAATADSKAVTAGSYANSAYNQANSAALYANAAFIQANAAYAAANAGGAGTDSFARDTANAAFIQANAAFAVANSGGGGGVSNNSTLSGTITPLANTSTQFNIIGVTGDITIDAPAGTPTDGQKLIIRIKDAGTSVNISWNVIYRVVGTSLPSTTVPSKTAYVGFIYNTADTDWDAVAVTLES